MTIELAARALLRDKLEAEIVRLVRELDGVMGVSIKDLSSGDEISVHADASFPSASAIKVPVLIALYKQVEEGRCALSEQQPIRRQDEVDSMVLQYFSDGGSQLCLQDLAVLMIRYSDNIATNLLIDRIGGFAVVNQLLDELGLTGLRLRRKMGDAAASARGEENVATPREAARMLEMLHCNEIVSATLCRSVLEVMKLPKGNHSPMAVALPAGASLASKTGTLDGVKNEWAIVYAPRRPFAIAICSNYLQADASALIGSIARLAYNYFARLGLSTAHGALADPHLLPRD